MKKERDKVDRNGKRVCVCEWERREEGIVCVCMCVCARTGLSIDLVRGYGEGDGVFFDFWARLREKEMVGRGERREEILSKGREGRVGNEGRCWRENAKGLSFAFLH